MQSRSLSARIRALHPTMRPCDIARALGTSQAYVRVVLTQRKGGSSQHDRKYLHSKKGARCRRKVTDKMRDDYNAVPRDERLAIRATCTRVAREQGRMETPEQRALVWSQASRLVRKRGRQIRAEQKARATAALKGTKGGRAGA